MARIVVARPARADLALLDWSLTDAVEQAIRALERDPAIGYPLRGRLTGLRALRVGSYRILHQLTDNGRTVRVLAIRHRSVAYKRDPR